MDAMERKLLFADVEDDRLLFADRDPFRLPSGQKVTAAALVGVIALSSAPAASALSVAPPAAQPTLSVAPPAPQPQIQVAPPAPQPEVQVAPPAPQPQVQVAPPAPQPEIQQPTPSDAPSQEPLTPAPSSSVQSAGTVDQGGAPAVVAAPPSSAALTPQPSAADTSADDPAGGPALTGTDVQTGGANPQQTGTVQPTSAGPPSPQATTNPQSGAVAPPPAAPGSAVQQRPLAVETPSRSPSIKVADPSANPGLAVVPSSAPQRIDVSPQPQRESSVTGAQLEGGSSALAQNAASASAMQSTLPAAQIPLDPDGHPSFSSDDPVRGPVGACFSGDLHVILGASVDFCPLSKGARLTVRAGVGLNAGLSAYYDGSEASDPASRAITGDLGAKVGVFGIGGNFEHELASDAPWSVGVDGSLGPAGLGPTGALSYDTSDGPSAAFGVLGEMTESKPRRGRPPKQPALTRRIRKGLEAKLGGSLDIELFKH
jgi:hypothetical protein